VVLVLGGIPPRMHVGAAVGALSALLVALFGALNKRLVERADPLTVTCLELGSGAALLTAFALLRSHPGPLFPIPDARDAALLLVLAMGCTLLPFALSLVALRHLTAYGAQLAVNLEPVYAIGLAALLLGEQRELHGAFYAGVVIVLSVVLAYPLLFGTSFEAAKGRGSSLSAVGGPTGNRVGAGTIERGKEGTDDGDRR
jgi:drug/metabolite transporter (DMT)-like permease